MERSEPQYFWQSGGHRGRRPNRRICPGQWLCRQPDADNHRQQADRADQLQGRDQGCQHHDGKELDRAFYRAEWHLAHHERCRKRLIQSGRRSYSGYLIKFWNTSAARAGIRRPPSAILPTSIAAKPRLSARAATAALASSWLLETNTTLRPTSSGNGPARTLNGS